MLIECTVKTKGRMPSHTEFDKFNKIEDQLEKLEPLWHFQLFVCVTKPGKRTWFYYAKDVKDFAAAKRIGEKFTRLNPEIIISPDPDWNAYGGYIHILERSSRPADSKNSKQR